MAKYTGFDKIAKTKLPAVERFVAVMGGKFHLTNLGTLVVRVMRSAPASIQNLPPTDPRCAPWLSVHATGRACDLGFTDTKQGRALAIAAMGWLTRPDVSSALGVEEVHDYMGLTSPGAKRWGRGWRCDRASWKNWSETDNGQPGGAWIHVEVSPKVASLSVAQFNKVWASVNGGKL